MPAYCAGTHSGSSPRRSSGLSAGKLKIGPQCSDTGLGSSDIKKKKKKESVNHLLYSLAPLDGALGLLQVMFCTLFRSERSIDWSGKKKHSK